MPSIDDRPVALPEGVLRCLLLQRTDYRDRPPEEVAALYGRDLAGYMRDVATVFPPDGRRRRILDIGCGLGFGLIALRRLYGPDNEFVGVDRDRIDADIHFGLTDDPSAYNSLDLTRAMLATNDVADATVLDVDAQGLPAERPFDMAISVIAWGFHFPAATYAERVHGLLADGGRLVIDLRATKSGEVPGVAELAPWFAPVGRVPGRKFVRSMFVRR